MPDSNFVCARAYDTRQTRAMTNNDKSDSGAGRRSSPLFSPQAGADLSGGRISIMSYSGKLSAVINIPGSYLGAIGRFKVRRECCVVLAIMIL